MKKSLILILAMMLMLSCDNDSCEMLCTTGPPGFAFEIADKESGENLFSNGTFDPDEISLQNEVGNPVPFRFSSENDRNIIHTGLEIESEVTSYFLRIDPDLEIEIRYGAVQKTEDCCSFFEILEFSIPNHESQQSSTTGIHTIFI